MADDLKQLIEELKELYRTKASTRSIAVAEDRVWQVAKWALPSPCPRSKDWFQQNVDDKQYTGVEIRLALLMADCNVIFEEIDKGLSIYTARAMMSEAKIRQRRFGIARTDAIASVLEDYKRTGKVVSASAVTKPIDVNSVSGDTREFYSSVKKLTTQYIQQRLPDADIGEHNEAIEEFSAELRVAFESLLRRVTIYSKDVNKRAKISIGEVDHACEVLGVARQAGHEEVDMEAVKRTHRKLSSQLHPDKNQRNADVRIVEQYTDVQDAYQLLVEYERQLRQRAKGKR